MKKTDIIIATRNRGKLAEIRFFLADLPVNIYSLLDFPGMPEIEETGTTFKANALLKARTANAYTGFLSLADDSGLEVDFLKGAPGIYSARFAGCPTDDKRNNEKLLSLLKGVPLEQRTARFKCVVAVVTTNGKEYFLEGSCEGVIIEEGKGSGGFGYDPIFLIPGINRTMAELKFEEKNRLSHRAKAFRKARNLLLDLLKWNCEES